MRVCFLIAFLLVSFSVQAQDFARLSGKITDPGQDFVTFTLYRNWYSPPENYNLKLGANNSWLVELPLNEISYCDLSFGENSLNLFKIEPGDDIKLSFDNIDFYNTLKVSGEGSLKWSLALQLLQKYQLDRNLDFEFSEAVSSDKKAFYRLLDDVRKEQLGLLNLFRDKVSFNFYTLEEADILGSLKLRELGFYNLKNISTDSVDIPAVSHSEIVRKSFYLNQFYETAALKYIDDHFSATSPDLGFEYIKALDTLFTKPVITKILSDRLIERINYSGKSTESELMLQSFLSYSDIEALNEKVKNELIRKSKLKNGSIAPVFILKNKKGKLISLNDFRGKNIILGFYTNDCFSCIDDFQAFEVVDNFFIKQGRKDLEFVFVNISPFKEFKSFLKGNKHFGHHLNGENDLFLQRNYNLELMPEYYLIDKNGVIVSNDLEDPSADSGRKLIRLLSDTVLKK